MTHPIRLALVAAWTAMTALATPALAQTWQVADGPMAPTRGASICAEGPGGASCLALGCTDGQGRAFSGVLKGLSLAPSRIPAAVFVDGRQVGTIHFTAEARITGLMLFANWDEEMHAPVVAGLKSGNRAVLRFFTDAGATERAFPLRGSSRAIDAALALCQPAPPPPLADPVADATREAQEFCGGMGGQAVLSDGFVSRPDFDGDGQADIRLDYGFAQCSTGGFAWCGTAGCLQTLFHAVDGGFRPVFSGNVRTMEYTPGPGLTLDLHGMACNRPGADSCVKTLRWTGTGFAE